MLPRFCETNHAQNSQKFADWRTVDEARIDLKERELIYFPQAGVREEVYASKRRERTVMKSNVQDPGMSFVSMLLTEAFSDAQV